jgi:hypothetical protein
VAVVQACPNFQKERHAATKDNDTIALHQPDSVNHPVTEIARDGARRMLAAALRAKADAFVTSLAEETPLDGRQRIVRCAIASPCVRELPIVAVASVCATGSSNHWRRSEPDGRRRKLRAGAQHPDGDRRGRRAAPEGARPRHRCPGGAEDRFTSAIVPGWARRSRSLDVLSPVLYLRGISFGDSQGEAPERDQSARRAERWPRSSNWAPLTGWMAPAPGIAMCHIGVSL